MAVSFRRDSLRPLIVLVSGILVAMSSKRTRVPSDPTGRWRYFAEIAASYSSDLLELLNDGDWSHPVWDPLHEAMAFDSIDHAIQAIADMVGQRFATVRSGVLQSISVDAVDAFDRDGGTTKMFVVLLENLALIDAQLAQWTLANYARESVDRLHEARFDPEDRARIAKVMEVLDRHRVALFTPRLVQAEVIVAARNEFERICAEAMNNLSAPDNAMAVGSFALMGQSLGRSALEVQFGSFRRWSAEEIMTNVATAWWSEFDAENTKRREQVRKSDYGAMKASLESIEGYDG